MEEVMFKERPALFSLGLTHTSTITKSSHAPSYV